MMRRTECERKRMIDAGLRRRRAYASPGRRAILSTIFLLAFTTLLAEPGEGPAVWLGPDGASLPFKSFEEIEDFLRTAPAVEVKPIPTGVTKPQKVVLSRDGVRLNAIFRDVEIFKARWNSPSGPKFNFHDSCQFECAAYVLSRLLGLDHVPPAVLHNGCKDSECKLEGRTGSLQAWVENAMTERERSEKGLQPPSPRTWMLQHQLLWAFDNLIANDDRNQTNILIGPDWKVWFIDSTRAFRPSADLRNPEAITLWENEVWRRLKKLDEETIRGELGPLLSEREIETLVIRREKLAEYVEDLIARRGEKMVLFDYDLIREGLQK